MPNRPALVTIEFGYDANGVIAVSARDGSTGKPLPFNVEALPSDLSWLSGVGHSRSGLGASPYTAHAGQRRIPGAITDKFGNAAGSQYDLARDGAFKDCLVAVLHLYCGEGFDFRLPQEALKEKGFQVKRWTSAPSRASLPVSLKRRVNCG